MPFHQTGLIRYYSFDVLDELGVRHAVFTRQGGVSSAPYHALNLGGTVGDDPGSVSENRRRAFAVLDVDPASVYDAWQVHSSEVVYTDRPRLSGTPHLKADAIITDKSNITLFMRFADCVPIFLVDPDRHALGIVHAGWMGTLSGVAANTVRAMKEQFRTDPRKLIAAIGPSICVNHYIVGEDVASRAKAYFQDKIGSVLKTDGDDVKFDLWTANRLILEKEGLTNIYLSNLCTACQMEDWYSHRAENGKTGRFGAMIRFSS